MDPVVSLKHVGKSYPTRTAQRTVIDNLSLTADPGELVWLRGRSGSGKSTLLNIIGLLTPPDRGEVRILGTDVGGISSTEAANLRSNVIGFVFQDHNLLPHLGALANVMLPGHDRRTARVRARALLARMGLLDLERVPAGHLSGGERQRVAVARALLNDPPLILADEPVSGLDHAAAEAVLRELSNAARSGHSVIVASHDNVLERIADRVFDMPGEGVARCVEN